MYKYDNYKTVYVKIGNGVETFSITIVKPHLKREKEEEGIVSNEPSRALPQFNEKVELYWLKYERYYSGTVTPIDDDLKKHHILYDDGDEEILDLSKEMETNP